MDDNVSIGWPKHPGEQHSVCFPVINKIYKWSIASKIDDFLFICHHSPCEKCSGCSCMCSMLIDFDFGFMNSLPNRDFFWCECAEISVTLEEIPNTKRFKYLPRKREVMLVKFCEKLGYMCKFVVEFFIMNLTKSKLRILSLRLSILFNEVCSRKQYWSEWVGGRW